MYCRFCGKELSDSDNFCVYCGKPTANGQNTAGTQYTQTGGEKTNTEPDSTAVELVGKNKEYYIPVFQKLKANGRYVSWNWPAFLAGPFWMVYRKLYIWAAGFVLVDLLLMAEGTSVLLHILAGLFANYVYMKQIEDLTAQAKAFPQSGQAGFVRKKGGVNTAAVIALVALVIAFIALMAALLIAFMNTSKFNSFTYYW